MTTTTIQKWGNSYAVRLPKSAVARLNLLAGHEVEIHEKVREGTLSIVPVHRANMSLASMVNRITKQNRHAATDWGAPVGKEVW